MKHEEEYKQLDPIEMGARIRRQREFLNLTREELAGDLGVSSKFVADIEYGEKGLSLKRLYTLTQILQVSADYILAGADCESEEQIKKEYAMEGILEPLKNCSLQQLQCMEQITRYYAEALKQK